MRLILLCLALMIVALKGETGDRALANAVMRNTAQTGALAQMNARLTGTSACGGLHLGASPVSATMRSTG